jgi:sporulation protein YlmC with PRC-barrel domain
MDVHGNNPEGNMQKLTTLAVTTALAMALVPTIASPVFAQSMAISAIVATDHSMRSSKLIGMDIFNDQGVKIGKIEDILVKGSASEPLAVLSVGAFAGGGSKMVAVPISHIALKSDKASMPATKGQIEEMPGWKFTGYSGGGG